MMYLYSFLLICSVYLIGAIPFGLVLTKIFLKQDIRKIGSGNIGATNVLRTGSKILAILTIILDALKPFIAYYVAKYLMILFFGSIVIETLFFLYDVYIKMVVVAIVIIAHCFPIYLNFKGGKGVASVFGSLFLFSNTIPFMALATWIVIAILFKKSSLAALTTAIVLPIYIYYFSGYKSLIVEHLTLFFVGVSLFVILRHISNIKRLIKGEESNITFTKKNNE